MKKIILIAAIALFVLPSFANAGELANIIAIDMSIGTFAGAAMGVALSTPSFMSGGDNGNENTFYVGAGWGALAGALVGLGYGIYDYVTFLQQKKGVPRKKAMIELEKDTYLVTGATNMALIKKF
jgi:hypothetical protein